MPYVNSNGLRIFYDIAGPGLAPPVVLIHGYTANGQTNWEFPGWVAALSEGYRLIIPDLRGHGRSDKPHKAATYSVGGMAGDVTACMAAEGVVQAVIFGYSMGGMVALEMLLNHPAQVSAAIIGGMGTRFPRRGDRRERRRRDEPGVEQAPPREHRRGVRFLAAYLRHYDPLAMRAVWQGVFRGRGPVDASRLGEIHVPVLCAAGMRDALYPGVTELATLVPGARLAAFSGRGHVSAVGDPRFKAAVLEFLGNLPASGSPQQSASAVAE